MLLRLTRFEELSIIQKDSRTSVLIFCTRMLRNSPLTDAVTLCELIKYRFHVRCHLPEQCHWPAQLLTLEVNDVPLSFLIRWVRFSMTRADNLAIGLLFPICPQDKHQRARVRAPTETWCASSNAPSPHTLLCHFMICFCLTFISQFQVLSSGAASE